ncbi:MAG TPA: hypothetical protein VK530_17765 [Candidatus Acidoferrum sp.]|nr:hypothetical protein [Candidatus Acidoferrum sp.]
MQKVQFKTLKPVIVGTNVVPPGKIIELDIDAPSTRKLYDTKHIGEPIARAPQQQQQQQPPPPPPLKSEEVLPPAPTETAPAKHAVPAKHAANK